jgi:uncharacterized cupredoxin-like copper-binding protein
VTTTKEDRVPVTLKAIAGIALVTAALGVAGCGGDDESTSASTSSTTESTDTSASSGGGEATDVSLTEFAIDPQDPTVSAGTVTFNVYNDGETVHNLEVEGPNGEAELDADLEPGDSGTLEVDLSEPGTYEWYCPVGDHRAQGMEGEVTVE